MAPIDKTSDVRYDAYGVPEIQKSSTASKWNPRNWSKWIWVGVGVLTAAIIAGVVAGAVVGTESNNSAYPDYYPLNYSLHKTYSGANFFDDFYYFNTYDPAHGYVHYVDASVADSTKYNLTYATADSAVLKVDASNPNATTGRYSVRIQSKDQYNNGLFVFDVLNTPYGCSTWPALWLVDPANWPYHGEIDVMEAVNQATNGNQVTLHTSAGCTMNAKRHQTGDVLTTNCLNSTDANAGCGVRGAPDTFGPAFNANGGGVYALEWRAEGIRVWFFPRSSIPADISETNATATPDPSTWGTPLADFPNTHCDITSHFKNQSLIADIDLCGDWAGDEAVYIQQDQCPGSCVNFVTYNNTAYETAFWEWKSWRVYLAQ